MAAAGVTKLFLASILLFCFAGTCFCASGPNLKDLKTTVFVTTTVANGTYLKAGENNITVTWGPSAGADSSTWKSVNVKLCYAPISQKDRAWRKTQDPIKKDKTCLFVISSEAYSGEKTITWVVERDVPTAYYFIRAYVVDAAGHEVAYGQTTDATKSTNFFFVQAITGRHMSLDIASVAFSAFSVVSLAGFFWLEKRKARSPSKN